MSPGDGRTGNTTWWQHPSQTPHDPAMTGWVAVEIALDAAGGD
jgi:hypothetical protein